MQKFWKRISSIGVAAALCVGMAQNISPSVLADDEAPIFTSECEDLTLENGGWIGTNIYGEEYPGYTGDGFVFVTTGSISFTVDAPETGMYRFITRCFQYLSDERISQVIVTRSDGSEFTKTVKIAHTDDWTDFNWGDLKLTKGENTITFGGGWGYCLYDNMTLTKTPKPEYSNATDTPVDPKATKETRALMSYLKSVYGSHIISGQQEVYGGGNNGDYELEFNYIKNTTGKLPAIRGFDFWNYNPLYGWDDGTTERAIDWAKYQNGIATACWSIVVPTDFDNYTLGDTIDGNNVWKESTYGTNSTFNTANAVKEGTKEYEYFQEAIKDLAEQLQKLQDENVPIIFRPLREAQGNEGKNGAWFWWGSSGAEVYKELWKLLYTTLTEEYGLHNIIWEYNSYSYEDSDTWYPGDDYVDIVAYDKYNCIYNRDDGLDSGSGPNLSAISPIFNYLYELTNGKKMVAMSENDTIPSEENLAIENAGWLYFCPWYGDFLMSSQYNNPEDLKKMYTSDYCITLDELPADLYSNTDVPAVTTTTVSTIATTDVTSETTTTTTTTGSTEEPTPGDTLYGDVNLDGRIELVDAVILNKKVADVVTLGDAASKNADCNADGEVNGSDAITLLKFLVQIVDTLPYTEG